MDTSQVMSDGALSACIAPRRRAPPPIPPELADVALVRFGELVAASGAGRATIYREIAEGHGPKALYFGPRFVRYRLSDVRRWLIERAARAEANGEAIAAAARAGTAKATKAFSLKHGGGVAPHKAAGTGA